MSEKHELVFCSRSCQPTTTVAVVSRRSSEHKLKPVCVCVLCSEKTSILFTLPVSGRAEALTEPEKTFDFSSQNIIFLLIFRLETFVVGPLCLSVSSRELNDDDDDDDALDWT